MFRRSFISLLLVLLLSCAASDPCGEQSGTCLAIDVRGGQALDALQFAFSGAAEHTATAPLPAGETALPVQVGVLLPLAAQGTLAIRATALQGGQPVAIAAGLVAVTPGAHLRAVLTLQEPTCHDGARSGAESDSDCGGPSCSPCSDGRICTQSSDCRGGRCQDGACRTQSCMDGQKSEDEADVDCGGPACAPCATGRACLLTSDCLSGACRAGTCEATLLALNAGEPVTPAGGSPAGGTTLAIHGRGFVSGLKVLVGGAPATAVRVLSATEAQATLPAHALGAVDLTVIAPDGAQATARQAFLYYLATLRFSAAPSPQVGTGPAGGAAGDMNGDGKIDLVIANDDDSTASVLLGKGDGSFLPAQTFPAGVGPKAVALGDLNGDGKLDLAVASYGDDRARVLLGQGDGSFQAGPSVVVGSGPRALVLGDLNRDGKLDLCVVNQGDSSVSALLGKGDGTFQAPQTFAVGNTPVAALLADLNGDSQPDLAVVSYNQNAVSVLLGKGDGTFQPAQRVDVGRGPTSVAAGDLNRDGRLDLVVALNGDGQVSVLLGLGDGTFASPTRFPTGAQRAEVVAIGDVDRDGKLDLLTGNSGTPQDSFAGTAAVLRGKGDGAFAAPQTLTEGGASPSVFVVADLNRDGSLDLALSTGSPNLTVLLNTSH